MRIFRVDKQLEGNIIYTAQCCTKTNIGNAWQYTGGLFVWTSSENP